MRALLYVRLSQSDDASTSVARQEADLRALAEREGWEVTDVVVDDGFSGGKARARADRALERLAEGTVDVLAVWKFDRWSRQGLGAVARLIEALDENPRALFVADRDGLRSTAPAWRIIASVLAEVARMERENTQVRVRSSLAALRTGGRYAGGQRPYGYRSAPNPHGPGRVLVVDEEEAAVVREAAAAVIAGQSAYAVAMGLNARGVAAPKGGRWAATVLRSILVGDALVGRVTHRGEVLRGDDGLPVSVWPPVVDLETWHRLRALLAVKGAKPGRRHGARLLSGILECASCGGLLRVQSSSRGYVNYSCLGRTHGRDCAGVSVSAPNVEEYVERAFLEALGDVEVVERVEEVREDVELAEVERGIAETLAAMGEDDADVAELAGRLSALKARRAEARGRPVGAEVRLEATGETFGAVWAREDVAGRRRLLGANVAVLAVSKGRRGHKGLDPARVTLVAQPAHAAAARDLVPGRAVV